MESLIKLTVRTPNQRFEDIEIDCDLCWTVRKLKEYLENVYPSKPASSSQRLIYLGKLLQDHVSLRDVFSSAEEGNGGMRTLHIVCTDLEHRSKSSDELVSQGVEATVSSPSSSILSQGGLRHRSTLADGIGASQTVAGMSISQSSGTGVDIAGMMPHAAQWQQQYQNHMQEYLRYMHQWQQLSGYAAFSPPSPGYTATPAIPATSWSMPHWSQVGHYPGACVPPLSPAVTTVPATTSSTPSSSVSQNVQHQAPEAAAGRQPVPEVAAAAPRVPQNQNVRMNAGPGGAVMEEEDDEEGAPRQRDWLDWVYMLLRASMLLSIVYFYSSTSRFVLVSLLGFIIYMYQAGYLTPRRNQPAPNREGVAPAPRAAEGDRLDLQPDRNRNVNDGPDAMVGGSATTDSTQAVLARQPRVTIFTVMFKFFISFFTSLVPQAPPPMQGN